MKQFLLFFILFCIETNVIAQKQNLQLGKSFQLNIGKSKNGTGDIWGHNFSFEYKKKYRKKFSLAIGLGATLHDGAFPIPYSDSAGNKYDGSYKYTMGAFQLTSKVGLSIINNKRNDLGLQIGGLLRYQSSSYYDQLQVFYPALTKFPIPLIAFLNESPQKTIALGGIGQLYYHRFINNKIFIGPSASFQMDTNGDVLKLFEISCGVAF